MNTFMTFVKILHVDALAAGHAMEDVNMEAFLTASHIEWEAVVDMSPEGIILKLTYVTEVSINHFETFF